MLASDGILRWVGAPVGKLMAGDDVLRPRLRIIADEQLTGAAREAVQARLDLWLKTHIERLLAPLFALAAAEDVTGIARGIAFQLIESLGVLERQKVGRGGQGPRPAARARCCESTACASAPTTSTCRRCSSPRRAALRRSCGRSSTKARTSRASTNCSGWRRAAAPRSRSTRTVPKALYRTIGYRVCGERAMRVDILERLADLIRPALAWRAGSAGAEARGRHRRLRVHGDRRDDVADRRVGRGFRLRAALARLSHGEAAEAAEPRSSRARPAASSDAATPADAADAPPVAPVDAGPAAEDGRRRTTIPRGHAVGGCAGHGRGCGSGRGRAAEMAGAPETHVGAGDDAYTRDRCRRRLRPTPSADTTATSRSPLRPSPRWSRSGGQAGPAATSAAARLSAAAARAVSGARRCAKPDAAQPDGPSHAGCRRTPQP